METYSYLLGFIPASLFGMMVFFAAIGIVIRLLGDAVRRDQNSKSTPEAFKYAFLFKDNWKTIVLTALLVLVSLRFAGSFFEKQFTVEQLATNSGKEKHRCLQQQPL